MAFRFSKKAANVALWTLRKPDGSTASCRPITAWGASWTGWSQSPNFGTPKHDVCRSASSTRPGCGQSLRPSVRRSSEIEPEDGIGDVGSHPVGVGLVVEGHGVGQAGVVMEADASYGVALLRTVGRRVRGRR